MVLNRIHYTRNRSLYLLSWLSLSNYLNHKFLELVISMYQSPGYTFGSDCLTANPFGLLCQSPIKLPSPSSFLLLYFLYFNSTTAQRTTTLYLFPLDVFCRHSQAPRLMSRPCKLLRSAPQATKTSALTLSCRSLRAAYPATVTSRCLATVEQGQKVLPDVWFTGSIPRHSPPVRNDPSEPHKPDERTLKLGKSKFRIDLLARP